MVLVFQAETRTPAMLTYWHTGKETALSRLATECRVPENPTWFQYWTIYWNNIGSSIVPLRDPFGGQY